MKINLTRYDERFILTLLSGLTISFMVSLFLLQIFAALLFLAWLFENNNNKLKAFDKLSLIFLLFALIRIITIFLSEHFELSSETFYKNGLFYLSLFPFTYYFKVLSDRRVFLVTRIFIYNTILITFVSIIAFNFGYRERATSVFLGNASYTPHILCALAMLVGYSFNKDKKYDWLIWSLGIVVLITGLIVSLGRTDIVIGLLIVLAGLLFKKFSIKSVILLASAIFISLFISFQNNSNVVQYRIEQPASLSERDIIWRGAYDLAFEHPVWGYGPRTFKSVFPYFDDLTDKDVGGWHNDYITVYMESGIIALFLFLFLMFQIVLSGIRKGRSFNNQKDKHLNLLWGSLAGLLALYLSGMTAGFINTPIISLLFLYMLAIFSSLLWPVRKEE